MVGTDGWTVAKGGGTVFSEHFDEGESLSTLLAMLIVISCQSAAARGREGTVMTCIVDYICIWWERGKMDLTTLGR